MIKNFSFILICLFIVSCSFLKYDDIVVISKQALFGVPKVDVNDDLLSSFSESILILNIGKIQSAILTLQKIDNGRYFWKSDTFETVITDRYGKIHSTYGLQYNNEVIKSDFNLMSKSFKSLVIFKNPDALVEQNVELLVNFNSDGYKELHESIEINSLNLSWKNFYEYDEFDFPIRTTQKTHPNLPKIEMSFYFKFD
jgi:hypothetical protein